MADFRVDQAAGLRRLMGGHQLQVVSFAAGGRGVGQTTTLANVAVAMAKSGNEVLVIDENSGANDVCGVFGLRANYDLAHVMMRQNTLDQVMVESHPGVRVLPAALAVDGWGRLSRAQQQATLAELANIARPVDVILVDASARHPYGVSPFCAAAQEIVVTMAGTGDSVTEGYALIKKLGHLYGRRQVKTIITRMRTQHEALALFNNMADISRRKGVATLEFAGAVPADPSVALSVRMGLPTVDHLATSLAGFAFRELAHEVSHWKSRQADAPSSVVQLVEELLTLCRQAAPSLMRA